MFLEPEQSVPCAKVNLSRGSSSPPQPEFNSDSVDREPDPESHSEELLRFEVGETAGGKKDPHHWPCRRNPEKNNNRTEQPAALANRVGESLLEICLAERKQEKRIKHQNRRALDPT